MKKGSKGQIWPANHMCSGCDQQVRGFMIQSAATTWFCITCAFRGLISGPQEGLGTMMPLRFAPNFFHADCNKRKRAHEMQLATSGGGIDRRKAATILENHSKLPGSLFVTCRVSSPSSSAKSLAQTAMPKLCVEMECGRCEMYPLIGIGFTRATKEQNKPEAQQNKPKAQQKKPEAQQNKPEAQQNKPEAQQKKPEAQQNKPEAHQNKPKAQQNKPEAQQNKPEAQQNKLEAGNMTMCYRCFLAHIDETRTTAAAADYVRKYQWSVSFPSLPQTQTSSPPNTADVKEPVSAVGDGVDRFNEMYMTMVVGVAQGIFGRLWEDEGGYRSQLCHNNRWMRSIMDLSLTSFDFGNDLGSLGRGYELLNQLDESGYLLQHPCLSHLWRDPRPPNRRFKPFTKPPEMTLAVTLYPQQLLLAPSQLIWTMTPGKGLLPDIMLAGVWPASQIGDLLHSDPRMATEKKTSSSSSSDDCRENSDEKKDEKRKAEDGGGWGRMHAGGGAAICGCGVPKRWPTSVATNLLCEYQPPTDDETRFLPRNWMPQAIYLLSQVWKLVTKHEPTIGDLNILCVVLEPEETQKTWTWDMSQPYHPFLSKNNLEALPKRFLERFRSIKQALGTSSPPDPIIPITSQAITSVNVTDYSILVDIKADQAELDQKKEQLDQKKEKLEQKKEQLDQKKEQFDQKKDPPVAADEPEHGDWRERYGQCVVSDGRCKVLLSRDCAGSVAEMFEPFPFGLYSFNGKMMVDAVDATWEFDNRLQNHKMVCPPLFQFICHWLTSVIRTRLGTTQSAEYCSKLVERVAKESESCQDERLKLILSMLNFTNLKPPPNTANTKTNSANTKTNSANTKTPEKATDQKSPEKATDQKSPEKATDEKSPEKVCRAKASDEKSPEKVCHAKASDEKSPEKECARGSLKKGSMRQRDDVMKDDYDFKSDDSDIATLTEKKVGSELLVGGSEPLVEPLVCFQATVATDIPPMEEMSQIRSTDPKGCVRLAHYLNGVEVSEDEYIEYFANKVDEVCDRQTSGEAEEEDDVAEADDDVCAYLVPDEKGESGGDGDATPQTQQNQSARLWFVLLFVILGAGAIISRFRSCDQIFRFLENPRSEIWEWEFDSPPHLHIP